MKTRLSRPKGTADVSPYNVHLWHQTEKILHETARLFGYREARFPTFEYTELFVRGVGDTSDVVQKEMYTFEDKGGRSITLRPEGTASVVRAYIENGENRYGTPYKAYYITPVFRYEKPQAGRYREHHQFGVECFGAASFEADAEVIALGAHFVKQLGIDVALKLNSIGCPDCRPAYHKALVDYFESVKPQLCSTCQERLHKNPMRILDCKSDICRGLAVSAPHALAYLCGECSDHFEGLKGALNGLGIAFEIDPSIVRGLDYYTKTVFEFVSTGIGAQGTVVGGGRYDGLMSELGGPEMPGVGFGCGIERLIMAAEASGHAFAPPDGCDLCLVAADTAGSASARLLANQLRALGIACELDLCARSVSAQMKHAGRIGARFTAVLGQDEVSSGMVKLKNMQAGEQLDVPLFAEEIFQIIKIPK